MLLKNLLINDAVHEEPFLGDIRFEDGKITEIGTKLRAKKGEKSMDLKGYSAYPGFVDAHTHLGIDNWGGNGKVADVNDHSEYLQPQLRAIDSYNPMDHGVELARHAGVTTICTGPGSASPIGGTFIAVKTYGNCVDDVIVKDPVAMKCALGENPKNAHNGKADGSRMTTAAKIREMLYNAIDYDFRKKNAKPDNPPKFDIKLEAMLPVIHHEIPLKIHCHRADDILTAIRIAKEFGVGLTLEHCTEGHLIVPQLQRANVPIVTGPLIGNASKPEIVNKTIATPGILANAGLHVAICSDAYVNCEHQLPMIVGLAISEGMKPFDALRAVTIAAAEHIGIQDRVGSLEVGKDADILITDGNPFGIASTVKKVFIDGQLQAEN